MAEPVSIQWELSSSAPIQAVWNRLSDTDRFNKLAELGFSFEEHIDEAGVVRRMGSATFLGIPMRWEEHPFQWGAPHWFKSRRVFKGGPAKEVSTQLRLRETGRGTAIRYTVTVQPRNILTRPLVSLELNNRTKPKLDKAFNFMLAELTGGVTPLLEAPPPFSKDAEQVLNTVCNEQLGGPLGENLSKFIRSAPLRDQARMAPFKLARDWGLDPDATAVGFLKATQGGALSLYWELICPACLGSAGKTKQLSVGSKVHCSYCNVYFDDSFADAVAVSFRPAPSIRGDFEVPAECIGSPGRQVHVLARDAVLPDDFLEFQLDLKQGVYRVRGWPAIGTATIEVHGRYTGDTVSLEVRDGALSPARARIAPGAATVKILNKSSRSMDLLLERWDRPDDLLTAGRLFEMPGAKELLPPQALDPELKLQSLRVAVVTVPSGRTDPAALEEQIADTNPRQTVLGERGALATYATLQKALQAARKITQPGKLGVYVSVGTALEVDTGERVVPMGRVITEALDCMTLAGPRQVLVPSELMAVPEHRQAVEDAGLKVVPGGGWKRTLSSTLVLSSD